MSGVAGSTARYRGCGKPRLNENESSDSTKRTQREDAKYRKDGLLATFAENFASFALNPTIRPASIDVFTHPLPQAVLTKPRRSQRLGFRRRVFDLFDAIIENLPL